MNLPNAVTVARISLVPVFLVLAYGDSRGAALAALAVFLVASLSDRLDGHLARVRGQITRVGQFLDPLADKLLVGAALIALTSERDFPMWAAIVVAVRELAIQALRVRVVSRGLDLPASVAAKAKTFLQLVMVSWWLVPWDRITVGHWVTLVAAVAVTVGSGIEYLITVRKVEEVRV